LPLGSAHRPDEAAALCRIPDKVLPEGIDAQVAFQKDAKGNVVGMVMNQAGRPERELKKIK